MDKSSTDSRSTISIRRNVVLINNDTDKKLNIGVVRTGFLQERETLPGL
jgi:hypothetical protein